MIQTQWALIQRELWEHRAILIVPIVILLIEALGSLVGQVTVSTAHQTVDIALLSAANLSETQRAGAINLIMILVSLLFVMAMGVLTIFYALDSLYAERKDKSILFWRSMPVTDAETVISKLATAVVVIPLVTFAAIVATQLIVLIISSVWVAAEGANAWQLIWTAVPFVDNWSSTLIVLVALAIWMSPFIGWFLFVSAFTKRSPFLMAFLPIIVVPMLERIFFGTWLFFQMLLNRVPVNVPIFGGMGDPETMFDDDSEFLALLESGVSFLSLIDLPGFLADPDVWLGMIVCGLLSFAAIYVRRFRDES